MNTRYYVPYIYRMVSADTIVPDSTNPQTFNRYSYVLNNPIRYTDPTGHCVLGLPCPDIVRDGLTTAANFSAGVVVEAAYNNSLGLATDLAPSASEPTATTVGRAVGDVATMVQGGVEMGGGASLMGGGAAVCLTGVGCIATPAAEAAGIAVAAHGIAVASQATGQLIENGGVLLSEITEGSSSSGGFGESDSRDFTRLSRGEIKQLTEAGYHPHDLKPQKHGSRYDIFKDEYGDLYVMPKDGSGPGDQLGININDLWD